MLKRAFLPVSAALMALMGGAGMNLAIPAVVTAPPQYRQFGGRVIRSRVYRSRGHVYPRQSARQAARYAAMSGLTVFRQEEKPKAVNVGDIWVSVAYPWQYSRAEGSRKTWKAVAA